MSRALFLAALFLAACGSTRAEPPDTDDDAGAVVGDAGAEPDAFEAATPIVYEACDLSLCACLPDGRVAVGRYASPDCRALCVARCADGG